MTKEHFTNMLRGGGHLSDGVSVAALKKIPLAIQGVLSQTFKLVATYDGEPNNGVPTEFIAKFLNPDPAFAFFRMMCGSQAMLSFQQEDWCYANEFYQKAGVRSVFSLENTLLGALHMIVQYVPKRSGVPSV
jgi:hypothetical protein